MKQGNKETNMKEIITMKNDTTIRRKEKETKEKKTKNATKEKEKEKKNTMTKKYESKPGAPSRLKRTKKPMDH